MNCARFETVLSDFMANRLQKPVMAAAQEHLEKCPQCRELLEEVAQLKGQLHDFPVVQPPADLVDRILLRTTGRPEPRSIWKGLILPTLQPFLTQRYAFATVMLFVFLSLMVNIVGPPAGAVLSPSRLVESADRFTSEITRKWAEAVDFQARVMEEVKLMSEDLRGRLDYHFFSLLFKSYDESLKEQQQSESEQLAPDNNTEEDSNQRPADPSGEGAS